MTDIYTIVTPPKEIRHLSRIRPVPKYDKKFQARPGALMPVIGKQVNLTSGLTARWGIEHNGKTLTTISMKKIMVRKPFNLWFHQHRCAIPANCFYFKKEDKVYLVRMLKERTFMLGGVCLPPEHADGHYRFAILTTESADVLEDLADEMPVCFSCHKSEKWITEETMLKVMQLADNSGGHWFDYYKVHPRIAEPKWNEKELLKPLGISFREWQEREEKLNALDLREERFNRNNSKGR